MNKSKMNPNSDIVSEILLKLPVESLLRCKSVCKGWYSLISSDHHFIKSHFTLSSRTNNINFEHHRLIYNTFERKNDLISCPLYDVLFDESANNAIKLKNPFQQTRGRCFRIVGSCNGLMCLLAEDDDTLFIYNPSTRTTNVLPHPKQGAGWLGVFYGFGYDETTHDYKVVKLDQRGHRWDWGTMVYSLKDGSWRKIDDYRFCEPFNDGKFVNGALHWVSDSNNTFHIVSLDLGNETYGEVLQPKYHDEGVKRLTLGVLGEWLCVLCNYIESCVVDLWVMKVYGREDSWSKLARIPYPSHIWWEKALDPLCISKDGKLLVRFGPKFLVYDSEDSSSTVIDNFNGCHQACIVSESLVSPFPPLDNNDDEKSRKRKR